MDTPFRAKERRTIGRKYQTRREEREGRGIQTTYSCSRKQKGLKNQDLCSAEAAFSPPFLKSSIFLPMFHIACANA